VLSTRLKVCIALLLGLGVGYCVRGTPPRPGPAGGRYPERLEIYRPAPHGIERVDLRGVCVLEGDVSTDLAPSDDATRPWRVVVHFENRRYSYFAEPISRPLE